MATIPQITANQQNSQRSTGPQSEQGKAAVSQNARKHGLTSPFDILPHEDQEEFDALLQGYRDEFKPTGQHRNALVNQMVQSRWQLARIQRLEICMFAHMMDPETPIDSPDGRIVTGMLKRSTDPIAAFLRYAAAVERSYHKANREFHISAKEERKQDMADAESLIDSLYALPREPFPRSAAAPANTRPVSQPSVRQDLQLRST